MCTHVSSDCPAAMDYLLGFKAVLTCQQRLSVLTPW